MATYTERPQETEYAPFYAKYIATVPDGDIVAALAHQKDQLKELARSVPPGREQYRYADGKWSIREVFGHLNDGERVFGYRAYCISRGDTTAFPSFDEKQYIAASGFDQRVLRDVADELIATRESNLHLFNRLKADDWSRVGTANANPISVRALAYIMVGHVNHHVTILAERYAVSAVTV